MRRRLRIPVGAKRRRCWLWRCRKFDFDVFPMAWFGTAHPKQEVEGEAMTDQIPSSVSQSGLSDNAAGGLAYVTIIPAIIFLIVAPYNRSSFVRFHSWQCIFLALTWFAVHVALVILGRIPVFGWSVIFLSPLIGLGFLILWIIVLIMAFNGKRFKVPLVGDLAEKQANS
jgi:uncharacterized membrane protein